LSPTLTVLALAIFALVILVQRRLTAGVRSASSAAAHDSAEMTANVVEQTQALRTIHAFSLQDRLLEKSRRLFERMRNSNRRLNNRYFATEAINESAMLTAVGVFLALSFFSFRHSAGSSLA